MADTTYANGMSVCHKNSSGNAIGFPDVCLSPPPPPAGPIPIPYPNTAMASDLVDGSSSVTADGGAIALKDTSTFSTSSGDEAGTQGGNVITHKTKGKAVFMAYSMDVMVEGKNVGRHLDPMGLNCATPPYGGVHPLFRSLMDMDLVEKVDCDYPYTKADRYNTPTEKQREHIKSLGRKCWQCKKRPGVTPDHQPPLSVTYYTGGCKDPATQRAAAETFNSDPKKDPPPWILAHCRKCSDDQMVETSAFTREARAVLGFV